MSKPSRRACRALTAAMAFLATGVLLTSCASGGTGDSDPAAVTGPDWTVGLVNQQSDPGRPVEGGTLTFSGISPVQTLDPAESPASGSSGGTELAAIYDALVRYDPVANEFEPQLAQSLEPNADFTVWTLTLRPGVTFSDGSPFDAAAVKASIDRTAASGAFGGDVWQRQVAAVDTPDPSTVVFTLHAPWTGIQSSLSTKIGMIAAPAAYAEKPFKPIGAGPFTVNRFDANDRILLDARPDYVGGKPHLDHLELISLKESTATRDSLVNGDVDAAFLLDIDSIVSLVDAGLPGFVDVTPAGTLANVNMRPGRPGGDLRVRQAIALAIDPTTLDQRVNTGQGVPSQLLFPESSKWHNDVPPVGVDPDRARQFLDEAKADGYDGRIGILAAAGQRAQTQAVAVQAMLNGVGFDARIDTVPTTTDMTKRMYVDHDFDLGASGLGVTNSDPYPRLYASLHTGASLNTSGYSDTQMDDLLNQLAAATDDTTKKDVITRIQQRMNDTLPWQPWGASPNLDVWRENVHGIKVTFDEIMLFDDAWMS